MNTAPEMIAPDDYDRPDRSGRDQPISVCSKEFSRLYELYFCLWQYSKTRNRAVEGRKLQNAFQAVNDYYDSDGDKVVLGKHKKKAPCANRGKIKKGVNTNGK